MSVGPKIWTESSVLITLAQFSITFEKNHLFHIVALVLVLPIFRTISQNSDDVQELQGHTSGFKLNCYVGYMDEKWREFFEMHL